MDAPQQEASLHFGYVEVAPGISKADSICRRRPSPPVKMIKKFDKKDEESGKDFKMAVNRKAYAFTIETRYRNAKCSSVSLVAKVNQLDPQQWFKKNIIDIF